MPLGSIIIMINVVIVATNQSRFSTMQVVCKVVDVKYSIHQKISRWADKVLHQIIQASSIIILDF